MLSVLQQRRRLINSSTSGCSRSAVRVLQQRRRLINPWTLLSVVALLVTACAGPAATPTPQLVPGSQASPTPATAVPTLVTSPVPTGGSLIGAFDVGPGGCPECFNPLTATAGFTWLEKYYSKLVLYDINFQKLEGDLAESWEISSDGLQYTFHLRKGVVWHDGEPFTSEDVKFTLELVTNPDSASWMAPKFESIEQIETPDTHTVVLKLREPNAALLDAFTFLVMLPKHALESIPPKDLVKSDWWHTNPIGTGPFKWSKYVPGQYVELVPFDKYWRGKPKLDKLINRYYKEPGSAVLALRAGEIHFTYVTADEARALEGEEGLKIISGPSQVHNYLAFNLKDQRFQDVRVRQAFMYAIDRSAIVNQLLKDTAKVASCVFGNPRYVPSDVNPYARDLSKAKQLLQEANWEAIKGEAMEIVTYYTDQTSKDILATIQQMLAEAGITVTIRTVDVPTFNQIKGSGEWTIMYAGTQNGPDPDVTSTAFVSTSPANIYGINIPELDDLYRQGRAEVDAAKRASIYQDICRLQNEQLPWLPLWETVRFGAVSAKVKNFVWTPAPGGGKYYDAAEQWIVSP